jgi:hypothetical protein
VGSNIKEFTFAEQLALKKQIETLKPDLVHFGIVQQPVLYDGHVVTTMHDLTTLRFRNPAKNAVVFWVKQQVYKWLNKRVARKSIFVITPTEFVKKDVASYCRVPLEKIVVTHEAAEAIEAPAEPIVVLLLQETQSGLRALIGLGQHRRAGLNQDVVAGEVRAFLRHVHIRDAAVGGLQVRLVHREQLARETKAALLGTIVGAHGRHVLDRIRDVRNDLDGLPHLLKVSP